MRGWKRVMAVVLAAGLLGGSAASAELVRVGGQTINASKVIIVVKRAGKRPRKHRHKHHKRVLHTLHTITPVAPKPVTGSLKPT